MSSTKLQMDLTRFSFIVDTNADPADLNRAVARFLLALVCSPSADALGAESSLSSESSNDKHSKSSHRI